MTLSLEHRSSFEKQGFLLLKNFCPESIYSTIKKIGQQHLDKRIKPYELESELQYPGASTDPKQPGFKTIRRLLQAYDRDNRIQEWIHYPELTQVLNSLLDTPPILVKAHHNCIMTKNPHFSSDSLWHQDLRYWHYQKGELISVWLALGEENERNGCLQVIPQSHQYHFHSYQFDNEKFFLTDLTENKDLLKHRQVINMQAGDVLFFHSRLLHAATRNHTEMTKMAAVFTFRKESDSPIAGTRSAKFRDIELKP